MKDDGGAAFPTDYQIECPECKTSVFGVTPHSGMSLRDYFAAKAMQAIVHSSDHSDSYSTTAHIAYQMADAMIAQRSK